ncbi:hypothetical protein V6N13_113780 [Hibiscus sabdariffa]
MGNKRRGIGGLLKDTKQATKGGRGLIWRVNLVSQLNEGNNVITEPGIVKEKVCFGFKKLNREQGRNLERAFSEDEIWTIISSADGNKAPGLDDFNFTFYQKYWDVMKDEILILFNDFKSHRKLEDYINYSFISLMSKKLNPSVLEEYGPISLVGYLQDVGEGLG